MPEDIRRGIAASLARRRWHAAVLLTLVMSAVLVKTQCGTDAADAIRRADDLMTQRKYREAVSSYEIAVRVHPADGELRLKLAKAHEAGEQWEQACRQYITAAELLPDRRSVQLDAVTWMLALSRFGDAADRTSHLLKLEPDHPELLVLLGTAKAGLRNPLTAVVELEAALRRGESFEDARRRLRSTALSRDDREAEAAYRRAYALAPDEFNTRVALAGFLWAAGDPAEGADLLKAARDRQPDHPLLNRALGLFYASRGLTADAETYLRAAAANDRQSALTLAGFYVQHRRLEDALPVLAPWIGGDPPDVDAVVLTASIEHRLGRHARAIHLIDTILPRNPRNADALATKAGALLATGDLAQAVTTATAAVSANVESPKARAVLARSLASTGQHERAFEEFAQARRLDSQDPETARDMAIVALTLGRDEAALTHVRQSLRLEPGDRLAQLTLAKVLVRTGDWAAAERAVSLLPTGRDAPLEAQLLLAAVQAARGNGDAARTTYLRVLQLDAESLEALSGLVAVELEARQPSRVSARVDEAAARHSAHPGYLMLAARVAHAAGHAARAESLARQVLAVDPAHVDAAVLLAEGLTRRGQPEEAVRVLDHASARRPDSENLQLSLAMLLEKLGRSAEAQARYERLLVDHPRAVQAAYRLAALYAARGERLNRALELATMARSASPDDPAASDALGWVLIKRDLPDAALPHLQHAVRVAPANAAYRYHLGVAYVRIGVHREARVELTRALELDPRFAEAADARAILASLRR